MGVPIPVFLGSPQREQSKCNNVMCGLGSAHLRFHEICDQKWNIASRLGSAHHEIVNFMDFRNRLPAGDFRKKCIIIEKALTGARVLMLPVPAQGCDLWDAMRIPEILLMKLMKLAWAWRNVTYLRISLNPDGVGRPLWRASVSTPTPHPIQRICLPL